MKRYTIGLITGILLTASAVMFMGAQNKNLGDISVNSIRIKGEKGASELLFHIREDEPQIVLTSAYTREKLIMGPFIVALVNNRKEVVGMGKNDGGGGVINIYNEHGNEVIKFNSFEEGGGVQLVYNSKGKEIVRLGSNLNDDGQIQLNDRYGDYGWGVSGKK